MAREATVQRARSGHTDNGSLCLCKALVEIHALIACPDHSPKSGHFRTAPPQLNFDLNFDILDVFLPVTVEAITTRTAATMTATIQRTQSTPEVLPPPKAA